MDEHLLNEECNKQISDAHLEMLSSKRCRKWRNLTTSLELDSIVKDDIDRKSVCESEKRLNYFTEWKDQKGSAATYKSLIRALLKIGCRDDAEYVYQLSQSSGSNSTSPAQTTADVAKTSPFQATPAASGTHTTKGNCALPCSAKIKGVAVLDLSVFLEANYREYHYASFYSF